MKPKNKLRRFYVSIQIAHAFDGKLYTHPDDIIAFKPFTCRESELAKHLPAIGSKWEHGFVIEHRFANSR